MIKKLLKKSTALTLIVTLMSSTISFCLSGCNANSSVNLSNIYTPTYSDTLLEENGNKLVDAYSDFNNALGSGNVTEIKKLGASLKESVEELVTSINDYNNETRQNISDADQTIVKRQDDFTTNLESKSNELVAAVDAVLKNADNPKSAEYKENVEIISKAFAQDNISTTSNDFQSNAIKSVEPKSKEINSFEAYTKNSIEAVGTSQPNDSSLEFTDETQLTDEMKALADELKTPLNVYSYIKNKVNYECYSGSRKGAVATFESNAGNDVDQASLLIAMLRYLKYPAKYVTGKAVIDANQAMKLTSAEDIKSAGTILASSGRPVTALITGGKTVGFVVEQTWVEACVPYTDYRGAGNNSGDKMWVALDTSVKEYTRVKGLYDDLEKFGLSEDDLSISATTTDADVNKLYDKLTKIEEEHSGEGVVLNTRKIVEESLTYLPLSLQYSVESITKEYNAIDENQCDSIEFIIDGEKISKLKALDIYSKRLVIEYAPETKSDEEIIAKYGSIFEVPAYLVKMVPQLKLDGEVVGTGPAVTLGSSQTFKMNVYSEGKTNVVTNPITAGSVYQITEDMQNITSAEITKAMDEAKSISGSVNTDNVYSDEYLGKILDFAGKTYYAQIDISNSLLAEKENISSTRSLSVGMTGYSVRTSSMFNTTVGINEGSLYIDIDLNLVSAVSRNGDKDSEYTFVSTSGVISSYYESLIWEEVTGEKGISTISLLNTAMQEKQSLLMLSSANFEKEKSKLNADSDTMREITNAVNSGKIVTIHSDKLTVDEWEGYGYIITDPKTGGAAYMISGGLSGGSTSGKVTLAYLVDIGFAIADLIQVINMIPTMLSAFAVGGVVGIVLGVIVASIMTALVIAAISDYISSIQLMTAYMNGDEEAGKQLITNAYFNVGFGVGGALLGGVAKRAVKFVAKNKVVKALGEELAEKLLKKTADPTDLTKMLKKLKKSDISNDTIKAFIESSDDAYEWLAKKSSLGLSDELLTKFMSIGDEYLSYSDDLIKAMGKSKGNVDTMIKMVSDYGSTAEKAIVKSGDYAVDIYQRFGQKGLKAVSNYGGDAVMLINRHGSDVIDIINTYGSSAVRAVENHGDDAIKLINRHGSDVIDIINTHGKDGIKAVKNYGDDAITLINRHGSDVIDIINTHGKDGIKAVKNYGDDAITLINRHGSDVIDIINTHGKDGIKAVKNYGDDAIKLINRHGNDVIDIINTHGKDGIKAVKNYGDDAIKAVKKGVDPTNINKLADDLGIKPDSYGRRGIKNDKAAQQVLNSQFTAKKIASTKSFTDTYGSIAKSNGFKTANEFKSATMKTYDELEALGTLDNIKAMRNAIPDPNDATVMQKVVAPKIAMEYLSGDRTTITGSVAKFSDTQGLKTYTDVYNGLRLDYTGENPFADPGTKDATMYAIRFTSGQTEEKIAKSVRSSELGNLGWKYPYTGTGFISSASKLDIGTKKPYSILEQGKTVIPEYVARNIDDGVALKKGAEMYKITDSGEEILYAIFDKEQKHFTRIGE